MNPSRRQRYFRPHSPERSVTSSVRNIGMNSQNLNVLEQAELVMDAGDPAFPGDDQQVAHEEIVDDGTSEMVVEHHHHPQMRQMHHHYDDHRQSAYQVQSQQQQPPRRLIQQRLGQQRPTTSNYGQTQLDMVQKLQNKSLYMPTQRPQTRISPTGARIVTFGAATRKRDASDGLPPGVKKISRASGQIQQHQGLQTLQGHHVGQQAKNLQPVKVVRLVPSSLRPNPTAAEHALIEVEANIKQTIEESKVDMERIKDLQEAEMTPDDYHQMLGYLLEELERVNSANTSLTQFYRDRQRHEKTVSEAREDAFAARIRQLETENRKLRDGLLDVHMARFNEAGGHNQQYRTDHMGQMLVEEPEEHVVIEGHVDNKSDYPETEEVPQEWIVEETVEHRMHMQGLEPDEHQHLVDQQQQEHEVHQEDGGKDKNNIMVVDDQFVGGDDGNGPGQ